MGEVPWAAVPPTHVSVSGIVADHFERLINAGQLKPGDRLPPEREIAAQLGVSRESVRTALHDLELKGLADRRPGRGTVVTGAGERPGKLVRAMNTATRRREEVVDLRQTCEPSIASSAAHRATKSDIQRMTRIWSASSPDFSPVRATELDEQFHAAIARAAQNPLLVALIDAVQPWLHEYRLETQREVEGRVASIRGHMEILQAIRARDAAAAADAMSRHISDTSQFVTPANAKIITRED